MLRLILPTTRCYTLVAVFIIIFMSGFSSVAGATDYPKGGACTAESNWFPHRKTPRPNDQDFQSSSNCEFHQWSWQMFLWLTQDLGGKPRFLSFQSPQSLLGMSSRSLQPYTSQRGKLAALDEYLQAGTDGILVDHNGRAVYYSQYVNPGFAHFVTKNNLTNPTTVQGFNPDKSFDIGTLELKASWKIVAKGENTRDFFTMKTRVNKLINQGGKIVIDENSTEMVTVALVGFHIGGVVNGHPEMIWATFEQKSNAPNVPEKPAPDTVISDKDWLFYTANTRYADCNINPADSPTRKLNEKTQIINPITQVCRQFEFGNDPDNPEQKKSAMQQNDNNIASLNKNVHQHLRSDNVWKNYYEVGAIWFLNQNQLKPGLSLETDGIGTDQELTGSLKLSNATIETFTQTQSTMNNCFRCHNTEQRFPPIMTLDPLPALNINISHAFVNIYFWSQQLKATATSLKTVK